MAFAVGVEAGTEMELRSGPFGLVTPHSFAVRTSHPFALSIFHPFALSTPHPFALSLSKGRHTAARGFDRLSPNGGSEARGFDRLNPNGRGEADRKGATVHRLPPDTNTPRPFGPGTHHPFGPDTPHPFALSLSKGRHAAARGFDKLSPNGRGEAYRHTNGVEPSPNRVSTAPHRTT